MRRSSLLTLSAVGLLICLLGGTGLFAALTDTADLGPNQADSAPLPASADLKLAYWDEINLECGTFEDNLTSQLFIEATSLTPGPFGATKIVCIKNVGSRMAVAEVQ